MELRKILIADTNEEFTTELCELLPENYRVRICDGGNRALELLRAEKPDLLVMDLVLPGLDGITLLQMAEAEGIRVPALVVTRFQSPYVMEALAHFDVRYMMTKPCSLDALVARIDDLCAMAPTPVVVACDDRARVSNILITLRVATNIQGYGCIREAILCLLENPDMQITKELYPKVAALCGGNGIRVERVIRSAIQSAWERRDDMIWRRYFRSGPDGIVSRPSNGEFLKRIADMLLLEQQGSNARTAAG